MMPGDFMGSQFLDWAQSPYAPSSYTQTELTSPLGNQLRYMPAWSPVAGGLLGGGNSAPTLLGGNTAPTLNPGPPVSQLQAPSGDIQNDSSMDWAGVLARIFSGPGFTPPGSIIDANAPMPAFDMVPPTTPDPNPFPDFMAQMDPSNVAIINQNQPPPAFSLALAPNVASIPAFDPQMMNVPQGSVMGPTNPVNNFIMALSDAPPALADFGWSGLNTDAGGAVSGPSSAPSSFDLSLAPSVTSVPNDFSPATLSAPSAPKSLADFGWGGVHTDVGDDVGTGSNGQSDSSNDWGWGDDWTDGFW